TYTILLGPSGSGKTTLLSILGGFVTPSEGKVFIRGQDCTAVPPAKRPTATVFQDYALFPHMSVGKNVGFGLRMQGVDGATRTAKAREALALVGLAASFDKKPHQLSGGQRQRVMIAMALANEPDVLIADEPTTALDVTVQAQILNLIRNLQKEMRMAVVLITHDLTVVHKFSDYVYVMQHGEMREHNVTERLFADPQHPYTKRLLASEPHGRPKPLPEKSSTILEANGVRVCFTLRHGTFLKPDWRELVAVDDLDLKLCRHETLGLAESGLAGTGFADQAQRLVTAK
ncbi:MAG: ATP-binding cassette domain-containing protein, partial [Mesorhizobium sp.]